MEKLYPVFKELIWGGEKIKTLFQRESSGNIAESWEVSVHKDGESLTDHGAFSARLKELGFQGEFPVLIKYIDAARNLSVQVHPDDAFAQRVEGDNGKTEMWYIVSAEEGAGIFLGLKEDTDRQVFLNKLQDGTVEELLNFIPVKAGECYLVKAGTLHAICAGCVILEIQQSSNVTYRVYDYNRLGADGKPRQLHVDKALQVINFSKYHDETHSGSYQSVEGGKIRLLTGCKYFTCRELVLDGSYCETQHNSFTAVNIVEGSGEISGTPFKAGNSFFVPCGEALTLTGKAKAVLTTGGVSYYAGVDLGGTSVKCGIVDEYGNVVVKGSCPTPLHDYAATEKAMVALVKSLAEQAGVPLSGVGVGCPGHVDGEKGVVVYSNNLAWEDCSIVADMQADLQLPVAVTNDANAAALGECFRGSGSQYNSAVLITLGTGVGSGIVIDGKLFEGNGGAGAEVGHTVIRAGGHKCTCGRRGCLEAYASATALIRDTKAKMKEHPESVMWQLVQGDSEKVNGKTAFDGAAAGDEAAKQVVAEYIDSLAEGVTNVVNVFRPGAVLLGGGISGAGDALITPLKALVRERAFGGLDHVPVEIVTAALKNDAGIYGAAKLIMQRM